ncbi:N-6 DNA methylase [Salinigranum marinum]|uniref:N-6 DNA methylase n=1 Tax=Salinigranum marinum TaxID=1515595 RepID=UPI002989CF6C|nr:N-6 DNA methylase [Salinigranum marinum]
MTLPGVDLASTDDYRSRVAARLDAGDALVTEAFDDWRTHVRRHHGAVFDDDHAAAAGGDAETTAPRDLFCDTLAFDAAVRALRRTIEATFGLRTDEPTDALDFSPAHDAIDVSVADADATATEAGDHDGTAARAVDPAALLAVDADDLRRLYERTVPAPSRRVFGEYYTPPGVAELGVEAAAASVDDFSSARVMDPGCGAGAFLTAALRRKRGDAAASDAPATAVESIERLTTTVVGVDVNPVAVAAARTAYLLELLPILRDGGVERVPLPVFLGDALGLAGDAPTTGVEGAATVLLGNPPWIPWERLPSAQKRRLREGPVERLGLFDLQGAVARLGHANDDLSLPFVWTCLDRYLDDGGVAAFALKRDHLGGPAGRLLRSGRVGSRPLSIEHVHDFAAVDPFDGVDAAAALYLFRVGGSDRDPEDATETTPEAVPTTVWEPTDCVADFGSLAGLRATLARTETGLRPVDPDDRAGPWHRTDAAVDALGDCAYRIRHGLKDDAKAVFSVEPDRLAELEPTHVYPYLRSKHVVKWGLFGHDRFLVPQRQAGVDNERALARESPATYDYLTDHRERLEARGSSWFEAGPFYSLFGLGPYTWAPYKVVWCRLGFKPHFAVVSTVDDPGLGEKTVVPGDHCMFVACDDEREAHYLCALLNAAPYQRCLRDLAGGGKAGLSKSVVSSVSLPTWADTDRQNRLADLSRRAHAIVPNYTDCSKRTYNDRSIPELAAVEREIDAVATRFLEGR